MPRGDIGAYLLLVRLNGGRDLLIGALGHVHLPDGTYVYIGSAMGGLEQRVARHLRNDKRLHWHIDRLLASSDGVEALLIPSRMRMECGIASSISTIPGAIPVPGFGCSDCRCVSHLYRIPDTEVERLRSSFPPSMRRGVEGDQNAGSAFQRSEPVMYK